MARLFLIWFIFLSYIGTGSCQSDSTKKNVVVHLGRTVECLGNYAIELSNNSFRLDQRHGGEQGALGVRR